MAVPQWKGADTRTIYLPTTSGDGYFVVTRERTITPDVQEHMGCPCAIEQLGTAYLVKPLKKSNPKVDLRPGKGHN